MNAKICETVTNRLIEEMEKGVIPWERPWTGTSGGAISHSTGKPYSLLNQMLLGRPGEWLTFNQCKAEGGSVRKGEHGSTVVFWKQVAVDDTDEDGNSKKRLVPMLRYFTVFHVDQCDGIKAKYADDAEPVQHDPIAEAEQIVSDYQSREALKIIRDRASNRAYYAPAMDYVQVPTMEQFPKAEEYYTTLFHEMTHSTGHTSRLNRFTGAAKAAAFGSEEYSKEELIAEIGAAALVNRCGIETRHSFRNSAAYLQSWIKALRNDNTLIIGAAGKAEKAVAYILTGEKPAVY